MPGKTEMFAQSRGQLDIEIVEGHDAIDRPGAHQIGHAVNDVRPVFEAGQGVNFVDGLSGPGGTPASLRRSTE